MTVVRADHRGSAKSQPPLNADPCTTGDAGGAQLRGPALGPNARRVPPGEVLAEITKCLVQLHKECYGKGPTKARTYAVGDLVVCVLQGGLTTGDRILLDHGRVDAVVASREGLARFAARPRRGHNLCDRSYAAGGRVTSPPRRRAGVLSAVPEKGACPCTGPVAKSAAWWVPAIGHMNLPGAYGGASACFRVELLGTDRRDGDRT